MKNNTIIKQKNTPETLSGGRGIKSESKKQSRHKIILSYLANGKSLNKFEAERLGDHCLNTTISNLRIYYQIIAERKNEKVKTRFGTTTVKRYFLSKTDKQKATKILGGDYE
jgi:3-deoxy-D-manno-octulosonate 8-phosphate phosphatase KdsC-like HAD superfamily phosphatase